MAVSKENNVEIISRLIDARYPYWRRIVSDYSDKFEVSKEEFKTQEQILVELLNRSQPIATDYQVGDIVFGVPAPTTAGAKRNTMIGIAPSEASGENWSARPIFYNRLDLTELAPTPFVFEAATADTTVEEIFDYVNTVFQINLAGSGDRVILRPEDFEEITFEVPGSLTLRPKAENWLWIGQAYVVLGEQAEEQPPVFPIIHDLSMIIPSPVTSVTKASFESNDHKLFVGVDVPNSDLVVVSNGELELAAGVREQDSGTSLAPYMEEDAIGPYLFFVNVLS